MTDTPSVSTDDAPPPFRVPDHIVGHATVEELPPVDPTEVVPASVQLKEALDTMLSHHRSTVAFIGARSRIETLVASLERERLVTLTDNKTGHSIPVDAKVLIKGLTAELAFLRETAILPIEAAAVFGLGIKQQRGTYTAQYSGRDYSEAIFKLSRLATQDQDAE